MSDRYVASNNGGEEWIIDVPDKAGKKLKDLKFEKHDVWLTFGMLLCGFLFWNFTKVGALGAGVTAFTLAITGICLCYFKFAGIVQTKRSFVWLAAMLAASLPFAIFDNGVLEDINMLFLMLAFIYWVCISTRRSIDSKLSYAMVGDAINQVMLIPFSNFACCFCGMQSRRKAFEGADQGKAPVKHRKSKNFWLAVLGVVMALPVAIWVMNLLVSADAGFEYVVERLINALSLQVDFKIVIFQYVIQFVLGIPVAFYLYGLIYGDTKGGREGAAVTVQDLHKAAATVRIAPEAMVYPVMILFNMIYITFILVQAGYLFSAFSNLLPESMTYAEYARRGFFELCTVAAINLVIIAVANFVMKRRDAEQLPKPLKWLTALLALSTVLLIFTAISKMIMYIQFYGLTRMRIYPTIFMMVLLILFAVVLLRQFCSFNGSRVVIIGIIAALLLTFYGNIDGTIVKYNLYRYEKGTLESVDYDALYQLGSGGRLAVYKVYTETEDEDLANRLESVLYTEMGYWGDWGKTKDFRTWNWQSAQVFDIQKHMLNSKWQGGQE